MQQHKGKMQNNNQHGCCSVALLHMMQQHASCANDGRNAQTAQGHKGGYKNQLGRGSVALPQAMRQR